MLGWKVEEGFREMVSLRGSETPAGEEPRDRKTRWEGWGERQKEGGSRERQEQAEKEMGSGSGQDPWVSSRLWPMTLTLPWAQDNDVLLQTLPV